MINRVWRLIKAFGIEGARRLPYILIVFVILGAAGGIDAFFNSRDNTKNINANTNAIKNIVVEIKNNDQSQHDAQDKRAACLFNLIVSFIDTNTKPTHADVDNCQVVTSTSTSMPSSTSNMNIQTPKSSSSQSNSSTPQNSNGQSNPQNNDNQSNNNNDQPLLNCKIDFLFLHAICPKL